MRTSIRLCTLGLAALGLLGALAPAAIAAPTSTGAWCAAVIKINTSLKANHYAKTTPLTPLTIADVKQLAAFQRTKCGITGL